MDTTVIPFSARPTAIEGLWRLQMRQVTDERGTVREFYRRSAFAEAGLASLGPWVQVNVTETAPGALRGLHGEEMHKLVSVGAGEVFGAYVDARPASPTFSRVETLRLTPGVQMLVPPGVCNGFQCVGAGASQYLYAFSSEWVPGMAGCSVNPLDADLGIAWPVPVDPADRTLLSAKDAAAPRLRDIAPRS